jgi:hypothetical protein
MVRQPLKISATDNQNKTPRDEIMHDTTKLVKVEKPESQIQDLVLIPVAAPDDLVAAMHNYQEIMHKLLDASDYYQAGDGISRIRKSGWRKLALAFGLSDEILDEKRLVNPVDPSHIIYRTTVRVWSRSGRSVQAVGSADSREREFAHPEHDVRALAHTRAKSRAIADILGSAELIAEELDGE